MVRLRCQETVRASNKKAKINSDSEIIMASFRNSGVFREVPVILGRNWWSKKKKKLQLVISVAPVVPESHLYTRRYQKNKTSNHRFLTKLTRLLRSLNNTFSQRCQCCRVAQKSNTEPPIRAIILRGVVSAPLHLIVLQTNTKRQSQLQQSSPMLVTDAYTIACVSWSLALYRFCIHEWAKWLP